jgi:hypothetical protein
MERRCSRLLLDQGKNLRENQMTKITKSSCQMRTFGYGIHIIPLERV